MMGIVAGEECYISAHEYLYLDACIKLSRQKVLCMPSLPCKNTKLYCYTAIELFCIKL